MPNTSQQNANLANDSYENRRIGRRNEADAEVVELGGVKFEILEHYRNRRNGYAGTIYQRIDTGEIVVAHRGTEVKNVPGIALDLAYTDGSMVLGKVNPQARDAIELTRRALIIAQDQTGRPNWTPTVTVTGHSLGGCLAQITAHHFGLRGETFNAYGAAGLGLPIPRGGDHVLNHVMSADVVSSASPHFGQVRIHAAQREIDILDRLGYDNHRGWADIRAKGLQPPATVGSHFMSNFIDDPHPGGPRSILSDPDAQERARRYAPMIDRAREDMLDQRGAFTLLGQAASVVITGKALRNPEPVPAGFPASAEEDMETSKPRRVVVPPLPEHLNDGSWEPPAPPPPTRFPHERREIPPLPEEMRERPGAMHTGTSDLRDARDPHGMEAPGPQAGRDTRQAAIDALSPRDHDHYLQAQSLGQRLGLPPEQAQNLGMAVAAQIHEHGQMPRVDRMVAVQGRGEDGGDRIFASYHPHGDREPIFNVAVDVNRAADTPLQDSAQRIAHHQQQPLARGMALEDPARGPIIG